MLKRTLLEKLDKPKYGILKFIAVTNLLSVIMSVWCGGDVFVYLLFIGMSLLLGDTC